MADIFVRYVEFPRTIRGVTLPNDDGTFSVYLNAALSENMQRQTFAHELAHIRMNHFYNSEPVIFNERDACHEETAAHKAALSAPVDMDGGFCAALSANPALDPALDPAPASEAAESPAVSPLRIPADAPSPAQAQEPAVAAGIKPRALPHPCGRLTLAARARLGRRDQSALRAWEEKQLYPGE